MPNRTKDGMVIHSDIVNFPANIHTKNHLNPVASYVFFLIGYSSPASVQAQKFISEKIGEPEGSKSLGCHRQRRV